MNNLRVIQTFLLLVFFGTILNAQKRDNYELHIRAGVNNSDMNYGIESLQSLLPVSDYSLYSSIGQPALGYNIGVGGSWIFSKHFALTMNYDFVQINYEVSSGVSDADGVSGVRPIRPEVPILIEGMVGYQYINAEAGLRYIANGEENKGLFFSVFLSDMIHLNTDWKLDVMYEDRRIENNIDFSDSQEGIEFRDIFSVGVNLGYKFKIDEKFSLVALVDFRSATNPVIKTEEDLLNPMKIGGYVQGIWEF